MLSEADLQELRGLPFDRLLLQVWPKCDSTTLRIFRCRSCGTGRSGREGGSRGLCRKCYERWWYHSRIPGHEDIVSAMNPGPLRQTGFKEYADILMAKRIGVCLSSLRSWREGSVIPWLRTVRHALPGLESEFGVPGELWLDALAISHLTRGCELSLYGREYSRGPRSVAPTATPRRGPDPTGMQYGYWIVLDVAGSYRNSRHLSVHARCLACRSVHEVLLKSLRRGGSSACRSCAKRLLDGPPGRSGFRGVSLLRRGKRQYWQVLKIQTGAPFGLFKDPADAARYYDTCMYERYGHTLFLNFPGEYDRSNDPVFAPVKREATNGRA